MNDLEELKSEQDDMEWSGLTCKMAIVKIKIATLFFQFTMPTLHPSRQVDKKADLSMVRKSRSKS